MAVIITYWREKGNGMNRRAIGEGEQEKPQNVKEIALYTPMNWAILSPW